MKSTAFNRGGPKYDGREAGVLARGRARSGPLQPRKRPRQVRAQATFRAIVDACAQLLTQGGYKALTTNAISERAGVSIGTLYEYFPNRDSIVAALATVACRRLVRGMGQAAIEAGELDQLAGVEHVLRTGVAALNAPENGLRRLVREAPFVLGLPEVLDALSGLDRLCQDIAEADAARINLPEPLINAWLISQMLFSAMIGIADVEAGDADRETRIRELARLIFRMAVGRDPSEARLR